MAKSARSRSVSKPVVSPKSPSPVAEPNPVISAQSATADGSRMLSPSLRYLLIGVGLLLLVFPALSYYQTVWGSAFNYPFEDDFDSLLRFINGFTKAETTAGQKLGLLVAQHNEHRIVFDRLVFLLQYYTGGQVNIRTLILIGNSSLLFLTGLFYFASLRSLSLPARLLYFVPVAYVLFTLHFWELTVWGMASLQNLYVLVFVMASFYLIDRTPNRPRAFWGACAFAILATFTSGNGLFAFPVGALMLWLLGQRRYAAIWSGIAVLTAVLYFWGFERSENLPSVYDSLIGNTGRAIDYFFTLTGSLFATSPEAPSRAGKVLLVLYLGLLVYLIRTRRLTDYLPMLGMVTFVYVTCLLLTATRSGFGVIQATSPRYGILSVVLVAGIGVLLVEAVKHQWARLSVGLGFAAVAVYLFFTTQELNEVKVADRTRLLQLCAAFYNDNPQNLLVYWGTSQQEGQRILNEAFRRKTYQIPKVMLADLASTPRQLDAAEVVPQGTITAEARPFETKDHIVFWNTWAVADGMDAHAGRTEIIAQAPGQAYAFDTGKHMRYDVANQMQSMQFAEAGFSSVLPKASLKKGQYTLWLHLTDGRSHAYKPLDQGFVVN